MEGFSQMKPFVLKKIKIYMMIFTINTMINMHTKKKQNLNLMKLLQLNLKKQATF